MRLPQQVLVVSLALVAGACSSDHAPALPPLVVVGVDGLEWQLVFQFAQKGELKNLTALMQEGCAGKLDTLEETLSPIVWTTIATGKRPEKHGIKGFSFVDEKKEAHLYTSLHRQSKALWNLFDDEGLTTRVIGWWCTFPVEEIRGSMIAQTSTRAQIDIKDGARIWKGSYLAGVPGQCWPEALTKSMDAQATELAARVERGDDPLLVTFGRPAHDFTPLTQKLWNALRSGFYADVLFEEAALDALRSKDEREKFDALLVYFGVTDVASHMFWRYFEPEKFDDKPSADELADFGRVIEASYCWIDAAIGAIRASAPGADLLVISDHGFHAANVHAKFGTKEGRDDSGHHLDAPPAVFIAAGPSFKRAPVIACGPSAATKESLRTIGRVEDVLPTLLVRAGLPYGEDMDGRPLKNVLSDELLRARPVASVKSHENNEWRASRERARAHALEVERNFEQALHSLDRKEMERLRDLGYVDAGLDADAAPHRGDGAKPPGDRH